DALQRTPPVDVIPIRVRRDMRRKIPKIQQRLSSFIQSLDAISPPPVILDPSDPSTVGTLIADVLLKQQRVPLSHIERFYGSGVYAIYYSGDFPAYLPIVGSETPIYVGKADPAVPNAETPEEQGDRLSRRLKDHQRSIRNAGNLQLDDFECRFLVVKSAWQSTAETYLIEKFKPIWNNEVGICYGFGKHGDSSRTRKNTRSPWDTLHPGRSWAMTSETVPNSQSASQIFQEIKKHFQKNPPIQHLPL
ncbi:MAG: Eco29kI family restriction endonuclease, partial [Phycisphaerae bacterium]|nr:Eco29kI family restriction endonuclease [Phycisphaerae bacterium]